MGNGTNGVTSHLTGPTDWATLSKTLVIELAFVGSLLYLYIGHPDPAELQVAEAVVLSTGATLGVLRLGDILANILNVRAYLGQPGAVPSGYTPLPQSTTLIKNGTTNASPPTA